MRIKIIILFFVYFITQNIFSGLDSVLYYNAYNFMAESQKLSKFLHTYKEATDNFSLCISPQIIKDQVIYFTKEIKEYEFKDVNDNIRDSMFTIYSKEYYSTMENTIDTIDSLTKLNNNKDCHFTIYFSKYKSNRLFAIVEFTPDVNKSYEYIVKYNMSSFFIFLFYFDEFQNIEKTFTNALAR